MGKIFRNKTNGSEVELIRKDARKNSVVVKTADGKCNALALATFQTYWEEVKPERKTKKQMAEAIVHKYGADESFNISKKDFDSLQADINSGKYPELKLAKKKDGNYAIYNNTGKTKYIDLVIVADKIKSETKQDTDTNANATDTENNSLIDIISGFITGRNDMEIVPRKDVFVIKHNKKNIIRIYISKLAVTVYSRAEDMPDNVTYGEVAGVLNAAARFVKNDPLLIPTIKELLNR